MRRDPIVLFDNGSHKCLCFDSLVTGDGVQSNQFLIIDHDEYLLFDPGGDLTYTPLSLELSRHIPLQDLTYILCIAPGPRHYRGAGQMAAAYAGSGHLLEAVGTLSASFDGRLSVH